MNQSHNKGYWENWQIIIKWLSNHSLRPSIISNQDLDKIIEKIYSLKNSLSIKNSTAELSIADQEVLKTLSQLDISFKECYDAVVKERSYTKKFNNMSVLLLEISNTVVTIELEGMKTLLSLYWILKFNDSFSQGRITEKKYRAFRGIIESANQTKMLPSLDEKGIQAGRIRKLLKKYYEQPHINPGDINRYSINEIKRYHFPDNINNFLITSKILMEAIKKKDPTDIIDVLTNSIKKIEFKTEFIVALENELIILLEKNIFDPIIISCNLTHIEKYLPGFSMHFKNRKIAYIENNRNELLQKIKASLMEPYPWSTIDNCISFADKKGLTEELHVLQTLHECISNDDTLDKINKLVKIIFKFKLFFNEKYGKDIEWLKERGGLELITDDWIAISEDDSLSDNLRSLLTVTLKITQEEITINGLIENPALVDIPNYLDGRYEVIRGFLLSSISESESNSISNKIDFIIHNWPSIPESLKSSIKKHIIELTTESLSLNVSEFIEYWRFIIDFSSFDLLHTTQLILQIAIEIDDYVGGKKDDDILKVIDLWDKAFDRIHLDKLPFHWINAHLKTSILKPIRIDFSYTSYIRFYSEIYNYYSGEKRVIKSFLTLLQVSFDKKTIKEILSLLKIIKKHFQNILYNEIITFIIFLLTAKYEKAISILNKIKDKNSEVSILLNDFDLLGLSIQERLIQIFNETSDKELLFNIFSYGNDVDEFFANYDFKEKLENLYSDDNNIYRIVKRYHQNIINLSGYELTQLIFDINNLNIDKNDERIIPILFNESNYDTFKEILRVFNEFKNLPRSSFLIEKMSTPYDSIELSFLQEIIRFIREFDSLLTNSSTTIYTSNATSKIIQFIRDRINPLLKKVEMQYIESDDLTTYLLQNHIDYFMLSDNSFESLNSRIHRLINNLDSINQSITKHSEIFKLFFSMGAINQAQTNFETEFKITEIYADIIRYFRIIKNLELATLSSHEQDTIKSIRSDTDELKSTIESVKPVSKKFTQLKEKVTQYCSSLGDHIDQISS